MRKTKKKFLCLLILIVCALFSNYFKEEKTESPNLKDEYVSHTLEGKLLKAHYIDVGQGDAIFVELPSGETMLIDAGESSEGEVVKNYIDNLGYTTIDYLVATHPHSDHIGGMAYILKNFTIKNIYMPKVVTNTSTYENLLKTVLKEGLTINTAGNGVTVFNSDDLLVEFIAPVKEYTDLNNSSAVLKITYKNIKLLFMGDAETESEEDITADVKANIIKVGHHGSDSSSSSKFVEKVKPQYAIVMVGVDNKYNHPSSDIIARWEQVGATVLRTDLNSTIVATTNGLDLLVVPTK